MINLIFIVNSMKTYTINCRGLCGKTFRLSYNKSELEVNLCDVYRKIHPFDKPDSELVYYASTTIVLYGGRNVPLTTKLSYLFNTNHDITLTILPKSFTMARNFDMDTLTASCPVSLEMINEPICCNHCMNVFEKDIYLKLDKCPICRKPIQSMLTLTDMVHK